ncbi:MAG: type I DNA topoisomerase [Candidatus Cloacimonetes bacterium]|nr:type I DNA topoisomerase [Candidatus Cloacimonadota bacterium]
MGKNLIIVESPSKAKTIGKFLGSRFFAKSSMGHIRDLPKKEIGISIDDNFKPKYVVDHGKKKIITELKKAVSEADKIYLASDHDREGEAIAWHLAEILKKEIGDKPVYRIVFNEITRNAIQQAVQNPGSIDYDKVNSQQARRILDRIVGYNLSPLLWKLITTNLSAGRVQSVALRLVCEREEEIKKFIPKEYWNIEAYLKKEDLPSFKAVLKKWDKKKIEIPNKEEAEKIFSEIKDKQFILSNIKQTSRKIQPTPSYITSSLQQDASRLLNYSAKRTMMIAQQLYEGVDIEGGTVGLITYMRTDSLRIANEALESCRNLISERFGKDKLSEKIRVYKNKSTSQDAHEAIRPTDPFRTPESISSFLSPEQMKLYALIWKKFVATQMKPVSLKSKVLDIDVGKAQFNATGNTITDKGFMEVFPHISVSLGETINQNYAKDDMLEAEKIDSIQNFTKPPSRYSEAALIKELESLGIGRPSTYATITNTIRVRKYVFLSQKRFFPTELGISVNKFLVSNFDSFLNVKFTAEMENDLDEIMYGKVVWYEMLKKYYGSLKELIGNIDWKQSKQQLIEETDIVCEKCQNKMVIRWGKNGQFLGCSNFPTCKNIKSFKRDAEGNIKIVVPETLDEECPKCGSKLLLKEGRFGKFIACSNYPKCKFTKPLTLGVKCPDCHEGEITEKRSKKGKFFYSCSRYPDCKYISNYKPLKIKCPTCENQYIEERYSNQKGNYKRCPKCGAEMA